MSRIDNIRLQVERRLTGNRLIGAHWKLLDIELPKPSFGTPDDVDEELLQATTRDILQAAYSVMEQDGPVVSWQEGLWSAVSRLHGDKVGRLHEAVGEMKDLNSAAEAIALMLQSPERLDPPGIRLTFECPDLPELIKARLSSALAHLPDDLLTVRPGPLTGRGLITVDPRPPYASEIGGLLTVVDLIPPVVIVEQTDAEPEGLFISRSLAAVVAYHALILGFSPELLVLTVGGINRWSTT